MKMSIRKLELLHYVSKSLIDVPSPSSLSYMWNYGSLLGIFLIFQVMTGLMLSFHFSGNIDLSFDSIIHIMRDVNYGWMLRILHANGASMFFLLLYFHIGRGIYYGSYKFKSTWMSGVTILLLSMATAFLGYVLPWGQMSFWAATVITNLLSAVPFFGQGLVEWVWGGFSVGNPTLIRFFAFHFILPFIIMFMVMMHLVFLHKTGSSNPLGMGMDVDKVFFHFYFTMSDVYGLFVFLMFFMLISLNTPYIFMDVENFIFYNPLVTPTHIQPEWYFLFAYAILRSVPSSIGGVIALIMSVVILFFLPFIMKQMFRSSSMYFGMKILFWLFIINWVMLTWIGACEVETPYSVLGAHFSVLYFMMFVGFWIICEVQDILMWWL